MNSAPVRAYRAQAPARSRRPAQAWAAGACGSWQAHRASRSARPAARSRSRLLLKRAACSSSCALCGVEHGSEQLERAQVQLAGLQHVQHTRELAAQTRGADSQVRFGFGHVQRLHAVVEHRAVRALAIEPARIDFSDVNEQPCMDAALLREHSFQRFDELLVTKARHLLRSCPQAQRMRSPPSLYFGCSTGFFELAGARVGREAHAGDAARRSQANACATTPLSARKADFSATAASLRRQSLEKRQGLSCRISRTRSALSELLGTSPIACQLVLGPVHQL